ncbi:N-6 DNA methylase [Micromonospora chokoriensis]
MGPVERAEGQIPAQLVTMTEIAEFAQVRRPTISNWRRRHPQFPKPARDDGQSALFEAEAIARWLDQRPLPVAVRANADEEQLMTYGEVFRRGLQLRSLGALRDTLHGDRLLAIGVALTALRVLTNEPLTLDGLTGGIGRVAAAGQAVDAEPLSRILQGLPDGIEPLLSVVNGLVTSVGGARAVERLLAQADRLGSASRQDATPKAVSELIAALVGPAQGRTLFDPAAGLGSLLLRVAEAVEPENLVAVELDEAKADLLHCRLLCHGLPAVVHQADSLSADLAALADVVVVDPPFTPLDRPSGGVPLAEEVARWADIAVRMLRPGGNAYLLVPLPALRRTRARPGMLHPLAADGVLRVVIQLPRRLHSFRVGVEFALLVYVDALRTQGQPDDVLFCDVDRYGAEGTDDWVAEVAGWVRNPDGAPPAFTCWSQPIGSLVPRDRLADLRPSVFELAGLREAQRAVHHFEPGLADLPVELQKRKYRTVRDLFTVMPGHKADEKRIRTNDPTGIPIIGVAELTGTVTVGSRSVGALDVSDAAKVTHAGDVVVLAGDRIRAVVDETGGSVVISPAQVVRIPGFVDYQKGRPDAPKRHPMMMPRVLAALLTAPRNADRATGSLVRRVDLSRLELPLLAPEEIVRLDEVLAAIEASRRRAAEHLAAIDAVHAALVAGVAEGALRVIVDSGGVSEEGS